MVRNWKQWNDRRIQLIWSDIPIGKLPVLTRDESVKVHGTHQGINPCDARWALIQVILGNPFVRVSIRPGTCAFRTCPIERFVSEHKCRSSSWSCSRKVANLRELR